MKSRLMAAAAIGAAALAAIAGCGSSSGSSGTGSSSGEVTLQFFGADYGTGPANSTTKYWDAVAAAFHAANPSITVNVQTVDWTDFPTKAATLIQNKQYPDIMEGNPAPPYAQSGLIYPVSDVLSPSTVSNLIPKFVKDGEYQGTDYGIPFTTSTRAMYYNKKIFAAAGIPPRRRPGRSCRPTRPRSRPRATSATACRWAARRPRPSCCCGSSATAAAT